MRTAEMEQVFIDAPESLIGLREEISDGLATGDLAIIEQPAFQETIENYGAELGDFWREVITDKTREEFGDDIEGIHRVDLLRSSGRLVITAARAETIEITKLIDHNPKISRRQRIARKLRQIKVGDDVWDSVESAALDVFSKNLYGVERGDIQKPEDLGDVAEKAAKELVMRRVISLDEKLPRRIA